MTDASIGTVSVNWAIAIGVTEQGTSQFIDPDYTYRVRSRREATDDDIYAACAVATATADAWHKPSEESPYVCAFLVFQLPNGFIMASPDVHEDIIPVTVPSQHQLKGALEVIKGQIIAQKAANITLGVMQAGAQRARAAAMAAQGKTEGGLIVA